VKIHETLARDPRTATLANNGQARITELADARAKAELRAELETFVCDGQFGDALERILDRYLENLERPRQEAAWVSGFFGSGKSHLLKMLTHLWANTRFDDGATARTLVRELPDEVEAKLHALDIEARRVGKPTLAAAGTLLGGNEYVRRAVLAIILRGCGWPTQYPQAMFCFWLRERGLLETVRSAVEAAGRDWSKELNDLYVSPHIARALLDADPSLASDERGVREILRQQFPQLRADISSEQFVEAARKALGDDGSLPLTVLVLDEVQQYIHGSPDRAAAITEVAEAIQTQLMSRVMLVAAGQSALSARTDALMWLRDRFRIAIELTDADVENVTRKVLLRKRPTAVPEIERMFERHAGEVDRHLRGTRLGPRPEDRETRTDDYPLLPTRRRFWEACFQAADAAGVHSQLRSQLRILHDSLHRVAERELGAVIPASDLFEALAPGLVNSGVLLNELNTRIARLDDGTEEGRLRRALCGLVFLIGKLPRKGDADLGVRADAATLADLLIDDVTGDSGPFRNRVAETLQALAREGVLMQVGDEFRLQTTEGAEWERAFRERQGALRQNEVEIATRRDQLFGRAFQEVLASLRLTQGESRLPRRLELHTGSEPPAQGGDAVVVWLRDGWSCSLRDVEAAARRLGPEDPTIHVFLPKKHADELRDRIIDAEAARQVLERYGRPAGDEGQEAYRAMESRLENAERERDGIVREILRSATVLQGGGADVFGEDLHERIQTAAQSSLSRLFPRFHEADHRAWEAALRRAREGSDRPFAAVGWEGETHEHPVAREVLARVSQRTRGSDVLRELKGPPFGWPQEAIAAALVALTRTGHLGATRDGRTVSASELDQTAVKSAEFRPESVRLTTSQRLAVRGLFQKLGIAARSGEEQDRAAVFLEALEQLAASAGGEPPLPPPPDTGLLQELRRLAGAEQLAAILHHRGELEEAIERWRGLARRAEKRLPAWRLAEKLRRHAARLPILDEVGAELDAVAAQRSLLDGTDHVAPLVARLADALRKELAALHRALTDAIDQAVRDLAADETWSRLEPEARETIRTELDLVPPPPLAVATDEELVRTLDERPIEAWRAAIDAVRERAIQALEKAACAAESDEAARPATTVTVRRGVTLRDEAAVRAWLEEHERRLIEAVRKGPVIVR